QFQPRRQRNARGRLSCVGSLERGRSTYYEEKALLSRDVQSNIAPASSERYGITSQQYEVLKLQRALKQDPMVQPS
ncbi:unnamed protein product, partial [Brassica rapa subsp. narinosa]